MVRWTMWNSRPVCGRAGHWLSLALAVALGLTTGLAPAQAGGGGVTTETLRFSGLGGEPLAVTTETLRFTGRARGE